MSLAVFSQGEPIVQQLTGKEATGSQNAQVIQDGLSPDMAFFAHNVPMIFLPSRDLRGQLWASVLSAWADFTNVVSDSEIMLDNSCLLSNTEDIFWGNMEPDQEIGMLFIDLQTRRGVPINGWIAHRECTGELKQSNVIRIVANIPRWIISLETFHQAPMMRKLKEWINLADICFVASASKSGKMDVSHLGGMSGFITLKGAEILIIPDYDGNSLFCTLGNFLQNPVTGITSLDFSTGNTLQFTGTATVDLNEKCAFENGKRRFWKFRIMSEISGNSINGFSIRFIDFFPFNSK
ncbi:pyridoxamine 5'-phosphate oxidase family protein [Pedobacter jamesrossensis]|uniref:Pyridoxamine 5'-phosphate oxidase family protein n=1 Tax=Pedobacter jamesrossensis TaxID=1908238 RepID=A0ABV8NLI4_9SPHI